MGVHAIEAVVVGSQLGDAFWVSDGGAVSELLSEPAGLNSLPTLPRFLSGCSDLSTRQLRDRELPAVYGALVEGIVAS